MLLLIDMVVWLSSHSLSEFIILIINLTMSSVVNIMVALSAPYIIFFMIKNQTVVNI